MPISHPAPEQIHLRLTIDILVSPEGVSEEYLRLKLRDLAREAYANGRITGDSDAVLDEIEDRVERIS